jgi:N-acetylmuramoyl-L-alanine amidase
MLVLHYTGMEDAGAAFARLCDAAAQVSAHYLIDEDGRVHRLVDESNRAWHAGLGFWRGERDINGRSIGIELANPGHEFGYREFPELQMQALIDLSLEILGRHTIPARNVVGHSDIAPDRKLDPGEFMDWQRLAEARIGLWPEEAAEPSENPLQDLANYGYDISTRHVISAFQRRYRPACIDGLADPHTRRIIAGLLAGIA